MSRGFLHFVAWFVLSAAAWGAEPARPTVDRDGSRLPQYARGYWAKDSYYLCGETTAVAFSQDGKMLAAAQMIWDPDAPFGDVAVGVAKRLRERPQGPDGLVGKLLQKQGISVFVWKMPEGKLAHTLTAVPRERTFPTAVSFSPKGDALAVACNDWVHVLDIGGDKLLRSWRSKTNSQITVLTYSPDGKILVSGSERGCTEFWEAATGELERQRRDRIRTAAFSADGGLLAAAGPRGDVYVWEMKDGEKLHRFDGSSAHPCFAFLPDGKRMAVPINAGIEIYHLKSGLPMTSAEVPLRTRASAATMAGGRYVLDHGKGQIGVTDAATADGVLCPEEWDPFAAIRYGVDHWGTAARLRLPLPAAVSPDASLLAIGDGSNTRLWDLKKGEALAALSGGAGNGRLVGLSPDARRCLTVDPNAMRVWDTWSQKEISHLENPPVPEWRVLRTRRVSRGTDGRTVVRVPDRLSSDRWNGYRDGPRVILRWSPVFSADGRRIAGFGSRLEESTYLWDADSGKRIRTFKGPPLTTVAFHVDGKHLVGVAGDEPPMAWDIDSGRQVKLRVRNPDETVIDLSPDGRTVLVSPARDEAALPPRGPSGDENPRDDGPLILRDTLTGDQTGEIKPVLRRGDGPIVFSADGRMIIAARNGGRIDVYDARSGKQRDRFIVNDVKNLETAALSADGKLLAVFHSGGVTVLKTDDRKVLCHLRDVAREDGFQFTPDGKRLLAWSDSGTIAYWDFERVLATEKRAKP